jgi:peptidoglycan/LPS O-acetylase OafA/YrhL
VTSRGERSVEHVSGLDGARAIAAYGVIGTHAGFNSGRSLDHGALAPFVARLDFGVTLFFLLSGFLLFRPFAAAAITGQVTPRLRSFWWRRALRILPAYWIAVSVTLGFISYRHASGAEWWSNLLLIQTYNGQYLDASLSQMWTLVVEIAFYAALPLLAGVPRVWPRAGSTVRRHLVLLAGIAGLALAANLVGHLRHGSAASLLWLPTYLDWFALGMFLALASCIPVTGARWRRVLDDWAGASGTCWIAGALVFWMSTLPLGGPYSLIPATTWEWTLKHYLYGAAAFLFLLPIMLGDPRGWAQRLLAHGVLRRLGEISYGVYLWHLPLLIYIQRRMHWRVFDGHFLALFLITSVAATALAALSFYFVERPLLRRLSQPWRRGGKESRDEQREPQEAEQLHSAAAGQVPG